MWTTKPRLPLCGGRGQYVPVKCFLWTTKPRLLHRGGRGLYVLEKYVCGQPSPGCCIAAAAGTSVGSVRVVCKQCLVTIVPFEKMRIGKWLVGVLYQRTDPSAAPPLVP